MTRNQLPEGVGKKIVEALKRQAEADITPVEETSSVGSSLPLTEIENLPEIQYEPLKEFNEVNDDLIVEEDNSIMNEAVFKPQEEVVSSRIVEHSNVTLNQEKLQQAIMQSTSSKVTIPANVAILRNLINTLPVGVTKQTGAQIIKQTLEAMGIPMNNVLKEAQVFQEELNSSTRECMIKIQEYKTQIMQLETSIQEYQQNITQVNDIVSLFLMADK